MFVVEDANFNLSVRHGECEKVYSLIYNLASKGRMLPELVLHPHETEDETARQVALYREDAREARVLAHACLDVIDSIINSLQLCDFSDHSLTRKALEWVDNKIEFNTDLYPAEMGSALAERLVYTLMKLACAAEAVDCGPRAEIHDMWPRVHEKVAKLMSALALKYEVFA